MANGRLRYELLGDASDLAASFQDASESAEMVETSMAEMQAAAGEVEDRMAGLEHVIEEATRGQIRYNEAAERYRDSSGEFVSGAEAQEQALVGVIAENQRLQRELMQTEEASERAASGFDAMHGPGAELGFLLQDLGAAGNSFSGAIRGAANNVPSLIMEFQQMRASGASLTSMFTGTGGLLIAVNAVAGALPLLINQLTSTKEATKSAREEANKAVEDFQRLADQALEIEGRQELDFRIPAERLPEALRTIEGRVQALQQIQEAIPEGGGLIPARQFEQLGPRAQEIVRSINAQNEGLILQQDLVKTRLDAAEGLLKTLEEQKATQEERRQLLRELGIIAGQNQNTLNQTAKTLEEQQQKVSDLRSEFSSLLSSTGVRLARARRTREALEGQVEALRNANRIVARREAGIQARRVEPAGQAQVGEGLPEFGPGGGTGVLSDPAGEVLVGDMQELGDVAERAGEDIEQNVNRTLARSIRLASQLGATLVQAAQQGGASIQEVIGSVLQTAGGVVALANPAVGAGVAGAGTLIGSFHEGGFVRGRRGQEVPAELLGGEFVMNPQSAHRAAGLLQTMNDSPQMAGRLQSLLVATPERGPDICVASPGNRISDSALQPKPQIQCQR